MSKNVVAPVEVSGTLDTSGARRVGLNHERIGMLMGLLIDQYTRKHLAALREYFVNARDSHIDAGKADEPVLVSLPTDMQPSLIVQDFGVGLTGDEVFDIFGTYGASTKNDNSDTTGGMGIGSKSAWTLGQQFVVTAVKNGRKTVALFALDDEGYGTCDFINDQKDVPTDEPNGVTISLAVPDVEAMHRDAQFLFETVDRGLVLVDGEEPTPIWETARKVNDSTWIRPDHDGKVYLVQGQVPYVVDEEILQQVDRRIQSLTGEENVLAKSLGHWGNNSEGSTIYFRVPIDTVNHHPSRERLRDTNLTINALASLVLGLSQDLTESVQAEIDAQPSLYQATLYAEKAIADLGAFRVSRKNLTYRGRKIRRTAQVLLQNFRLTNKTWRSNSARIVASEEHHTVDVEQVHRTLTVTGVPEGDEGKVSRYLKRYLENTDRDVTRVFVSSQPWGVFDWFAFGTETGAPTLTLEEFRAELREMRTSNPRTANEPSYTTGFTTASRDLEERDLLTDIMDWGKDIVVFHDSARLAPMARAALADYTVVVLLATQSEKALRKRVEEAGTVKIVDRDYREIVAEYAKAQAGSVTDDERAALGAIAWLRDNRSSLSTWSSWAQRVDGDITSPYFTEVLDAKALAEMVAADLTEERKTVLDGLANYAPDQVTPQSFDYEVPNFGDVYPLLRRVDGYYLRNDDAARADAVAYINTKK